MTGYSLRNRKESDTAEWLNTVADKYQCQQGLLCGLTLCHLLAHKYLEWLISVLFGREGRGTPIQIYTLTLSKLGKAESFSFLSATSNLPLAQNNPYAKVEYLGMVYSATFQLEYQWGMVLCNIFLNAIMLKPKSWILNLLNLLIVRKHPKLSDSFEHRTRTWGKLKKKKKKERRLL